MRHRNALSRPWRLANSRGAAFLLLIYFASLMLFLLGGVSLQRTMTEVRAAQVSRDSLQAFYLAEGALDHALRSLVSDINAVPDNILRTISTPLGQATYTVTTTSAPSERPIARRISANGSMNSARQLVQVNISEPEAPPPLQGLVTGGRIYLYGPAGALGPDQYMQVHGTVHAGGGNTMVMTVNRTKMTGSVSIGSSRPDSVDWMWPAYANVYGPGVDMSRYPLSFVGPPTLSSGPGAQMYPGLVESNHFASAPTVQATLVPDISDPSYGMRTDETIRCGRSASLALGGTDQRVIGDGDPLDLTGPGDGKIVVCMGDVSLGGNSQLTFTAPATLYVIGSSYSQNEHASVQAVSGGMTLPNGVEIVMPRWANPLPSTWGYAGRWELEDWYPPRVTIAGGTFHGSIWAPYADLMIRSNRDAGDVLEPVNIFAYITRIYGASTHETFRFGSSAISSGASGTPKFVINSWSN